jgi:hypothetical protein
MNHDRLDPRTQTRGKSPNAKKSMATAAKVPPANVDAKFGVEDHTAGDQTIDRDVDAANEDDDDAGTPGDSKRRHPDQNVARPT